MIKRNPFKNRSHHLLFQSNTLLKKNCFIIFSTILMNYTVWSYQPSTKPNDLSSNKKTNKLHYKNVTVKTKDNVILITGKGINQNNTTKTNQHYILKYKTPSEKKAESIIKLLESIKCGDTYPSVIKKLGSPPVKYLSSDKNKHLSYYHSKMEFQQNILIKYNHLSEKEITQYLLKTEKQKTIKKKKQSPYDTVSYPCFPLPKTKILHKNYKKGICPLKIRTRKNGLNYYVKLTPKHSNKKIMTAFIRGGETLNIRVPLGSYKIRYAAGKHWCGEYYLFGENTLYNKLKETFTFKKETIVKGRRYKPGTIRYDGYNIELFLQHNGNLKSESIGQNDF